MYLPPGRWYSYWTDVQAPDTSTEAWVPTPLAHIPVFVKGGCVVPRWPVQQYVGELEVPPVTLDLWWAPELVQQSELYEDEGDGYGYRRGRYMLHRFEYRAQLRSFSLHHQVNLHAEQQDRRFEFALHSLPPSAAPLALVDGAELHGEFDDRHVFRASLPLNFSELSIRF